MKFILTKDLMNIFTASQEGFVKILMIIIMIELLRFSKHSLISLRALKNSSWMNFMSIISIMIEISRSEGINETCEIIGMIIW